MKYLVYVCDENGLGHLFNALLQSAYYAHRTGRTLALDMRRLIYFRSNRHAEFLKHFGWQFPDTLEVITDLKEVDRLVASPRVKMVVEGDRLDISRPFEEDVVIVPAYTPGEPYTVDRRQAETPFHLTLKGALAERWEQAKKQAAWTGSAVGMHFRSMTGEFVERMNRFVIPDFDARVDAIRDTYIYTARSLANSAELSDPAYFVASDDTGFIDYMRARVNCVVTTGSQIPTRPDQSWSQHLAENNFDLSILSDAVNDLWFLSECDAIVRSPHSGYSKFAILNSRKITSSRIVDVPVPTCAEIFASLNPDVAVNWTRVALREAQARRIRDAYPYRWFIDALERAGRNDEGQHIRKLANWQWEATYSPAVHVPGEHWSPGDLRGDKLNVAIAIVRRVAERLPANPYVLAGYPPRSLAHLLAEAGRLDDAVAIARQAIEMEPTDAYLRRHLGELLMKCGRFDEAESALRQAVALVPDDGTLFGEYAQCLIRLDRTPEAIRMLRVAIALRPDRLPWRLELSRILVETGAFSQAKAALMDGLPADARKAEVLNALSVVLEKAGKRQEAIDAISDACEREPHVLRWKYRLGELCSASGDVERAIEAFIQILRVTPESGHANHAIGILYQKQGKLDEALNAARRAAAVEPEGPHRHARLGEVLIRCGEFAAAEKALRTAVGLRDDSAETRFVLSNVLERLGRLPDALASARRAVEIAPSEQRLQNWVADLAGRLDALERLDEAEQMVEAALASSPSDFGKLVEYATIANRRGNWSEAVARWKTVRSYFPSECAGYVGAARALRELRRFDEADALLEEAMRRSPQDPQPFLDYGATATRRGDWHAARLRLTDARRRFPHDINIQQAWHEAQVRVAGEVDVDHAVTPEATSAVVGAQPEMRDIVSAFASLGGEYRGCEFGEVQRFYGAEPLDLLRWTHFPPEGLITALESRFEGVGLPEHTEIFSIPSGARQIYEVADRRFGMGMHTFVFTDDVSQEKLAAQTYRRMQYLRGKLIDDLESGDKIFVYRTVVRNLTDDELDRLYAAIRSYGDRTTLLYLSYADEFHPKGTVEVRRPGLLIGYLDRFGATPSGKLVDIQFASWAAVCQEAYRRWQEGQEGIPPK